MTIQPEEKLNYPFDVAAGLRATVVVDAASLSYAIRDARKRLNLRSSLDRNGNPQPWLPIKPDLPRLLEGLSRRGVHGDSLFVSIPTHVVRTSAHDQLELADDRVRGWRTWAERQIEAVRALRGEQTVNHVEILHGAFDGANEVGVDELAAWFALEAAGQILDGGEQDHRCVVIVSHDTDMHSLWTYAAPVRTFVASTFSAPELKKLRGLGKTPYISFDDEFMAGLDPDQQIFVDQPPSLERLPADRTTIQATSGLATGDVVLIKRRENVPATVVSAALDKHPGTVSGLIPVGHLGESRTLAIVDSYGLYKVARRAIGVALLPRPDAVQSVLDHLHWPSPIAVHSIVPSLSEAHTPEDLLPEDLAAAWVIRHGELDSLASLHVNDDDVLTHAMRSSLRPVTDAHRRREVASAAGIDPRLTGDQLTQLVRKGPATKQLATGMVAELWRAIRTNPDLWVVLVTEDVGVAWLLRMQATTDHRFRRVARIGLHRSQTRVMAIPTGVLAGTATTVVLTEWLAAELVGVLKRPFARQLRDGLADAIAAGVRPELVGVDPETGGYVVTIAMEATGIDEADGRDQSSFASEFLGDAIDILESILHPDAQIGLDLSLSGILDELDDTTRVIDLYFDRDNTCSFPQLRLGDASADSQIDKHAVVIDRDSDHVGVDFDGDGLIDARVPTGHDTSSYPAGGKVVLRRLGDDNNGHWVLVDPGPDLDTIHDRHIDVLQVIDVHPDRVEVCRRADLLKGVLFAVPGGRIPQLNVGSLVLGVKLAVNDDPQSAAWVALSTEVAHVALNPEQ